MKRTLWWVLRAAVAALFVSGAAFAQSGTSPAQSGPALSGPALSGRITGRVIAADTGLPLDGATVTLSAADGGILELPSTPRQTQADGSFEFVNLPPVEFTLRATRGGYFITTPVSLRDRQRAAVVLSMNRGGVIAGRIAGQFGEPVAGVQVHARRLQYAEDGSRTAVRDVPADITDDLGEFRLFGLAAGDYTVSAQAVPISYVNGQALPAPTYYPGTLDAAEAEVLSVRSGQELSIQFVLSAGKLARISGRVIVPSGTPSAMATVVLSGSGDTAGVLASTTVGFQPGGTFEFSGVAAGDYWLAARTLDGSAAMGSMAVSVRDHDVTDLALVTRVGATLRGTVVFDGPRPLTGVPMRVEPADGQRSPYSSALLPSPSVIARQENDQFEMRGVFGRVVLVPANPDWMVTSVTGAGINALDGIDVDGRSEINGLRVTLSNRLTEVSGRVTGGRGEPLAGALVVVQKAEGLLPPRELGSRTLRTDADGRFDVRGLRAGSYVAAALADLDSGAQFSPDFRERLAERGQRFALDEGGKVVLDLKLTGGLR